MLKTILNKGNSTLFNSFSFDKQGDLNQKEIQLNLCNIFSILVFDGLNLCA